ncbi:hypothetical protein Tco_1338280 [Tanacetum coccineum]
MVPKALFYEGNPQMDLQDQGVIDSGCSRHMTGNMSCLTDFEEIDGGYVAFGGNPKGGKITGRGNAKLILSNLATFCAENNQYRHVMRPFGCPVTILNTIDHKGKISIVRCCMKDSLLGTQSMKYDLNMAFNIDALTKSMNYKPVVAGNQSNGYAGTKACDDACKARMETVPGKDYILLPLWLADLHLSKIKEISSDAEFNLQIK